MHQEMEKAAMSLAAAAVSPIVTRLSEKALSYFGGDITEGELHDLKSIILPKIQTVIKAVDNINIDDLKPWVMSLRAAAYEAEDVMDMYEYNHLQEQVSPPPANSLETFHRASKEFFAKEFFAPVTLKTELKKCLEKLQKAYAEADGVFGPLVASSMASSSVLSSTTYRQPSVSSLSSEVFGRDEELNTIVDMLISEGDGPSNNNESRIPILAIWGIAGAGKTTLAQYIFNDRRIAKHFPMKLWVDVSRQLDVLKATTKLVVDATETEHLPKESLDALQARLKKHLESNNKFLLVVDDVWLDEDQNRLQLDQLLIPFKKVGDIGSRILVTTRAFKSAWRTGAKQIIPIKELESEYCWSIIKQYAFGDSQKIISDPELVKIGDHIVEKLKNSPLAATLVGIQLGNQVDVNEWRKVLRGDILEDTRNALLWSYKKLPQDLQQCFSFCSLFPKGWIFCESELVRLWIAQGFMVVSHRSKLTIEDEGRKNFNDLLSFSFFQRHPQKVNEYVIHDLLHDLAEEVSQDHCFRIEGDKPRHIPPTVVHLSINVTIGFAVNIPNILELVNLRTLFIISLSRFDFINNFHDTSKMFQKLNKLRILHLGDNSLPELHSSICELKYIRYLQLSHVRTLPESLGRLYHLHFLLLDDDEIKVMPKSMSNLINLKYFYACQYDKISEMPEFGKLTSLQTLETYNANRRSQCGIDQLKNLQELRGSLEIEKLQNVENKAEACEARLKDKTHLDQLSLQWDMNTERNDRAVAAEVLEGLEPPSNLKELEIYSYIGGGSPKWLEDNQCLSNLQRLTLCNCSNLQVLPPLGQLSFLQKLSIENAKAIEGIGPEFYGGGRDIFPSLKVLKLKKMEKWEQWHGAEGVELHPCLEELVIEDCPKLIRMPSLPPTLRILQIHNCPSLEEVDIEGPLIGVETLKIPHDEVLVEAEESAHHPSLLLKRLSLKGCSYITSLSLGHRLTALQSLCIGNCVNLRSLALINQLTALQFLQIKHCESLKSLLLGFQLTAMQFLCIDDCKNLSSLVGLSLLTSLHRLEILNCPMLSSPRLISLPSSLQSIQIENCKEFPMPPGCLLGLTSLVELRIRGCPNLQSLPDLSDLSALKILEVVGCPQLTCIGNLHCLTSLQRLKVMRCPKLIRGRGGGNCNGGGERLDGRVSSSVTQDVEIDETLLLSSVPLLQEKALNSLQKLTISGSRGQDMLPRLTSLLHLTFCYLRSLSLPESLSSLSSLQSLNILSCPNLKSLPNLENLSSLKELYIWDCPHIESLPNLDSLSSLLSFFIFCCTEIGSLPNLDELSSLESLDISSCPKIESLPDLSSLPSLKKLRLCDFPDIESLPGLDELSSLEELQIKGCPGIELLPNLEKHASLKLLYISHCPKIKSLQNLNLEKLSSLERLHIFHFPQLKSLPSLPSSLQTLELFKCHQELRRKYGMGGPFRHKLRHIPKIKGADLEYKAGSDDMDCGCSPFRLLRCLTVSDNNSDDSAESDGDSDYSTE